MPAEYCAYMQHYLIRAIADTTTTVGDSSALDEIRKVAALAVACMEQNGVVLRYEPLVYNARDKQEA